VKLKHPELAFVIAHTPAKIEPGLNPVPAPPDNTALATALEVAIAPAAPIYLTKPLSDS